MLTTRTIRVMVALLGISLCAAAQDNSDSGRNAPAPALGQTAPVLNPDNPPISGLDEPGLDLRSSARSFISGGLSVSETADSNASNQLGAKDVTSVTHVLGAFDLQRFYAKTDIIAEYVGGGAFYSDATRTASSLQAFGVMGVYRWRTGRLTVRDSFSYLPEGSFNIGAFGGVPGLGIATGGSESGLVGGGLPGSHFFGNGQFGSIGLTPRLSNDAFVDAVQSLTPRSAVTVAVGFGNAHFFDPSEVLINSDKEMVEGGYSYLLTRRDQVAAIYAFQQFRFPQDVGGQIDAQVMNFRWSHALSGKMTFIAGAGPQYIKVEDPFLGDVTHWSVAARGVLRYRFTKTEVAATYEKFISAGSGFFAGSDTQAVRFGVTRPFGRNWETYFDAGYAHNKRLQSQGGGAGEPGNTFDHEFARILVRRHLSREFSAFAAYRFNDLSFDNAFCGTGICNRISQRHMGTVGVEWHPRPARLD